MRHPRPAAAFAALLAATSLLLGACSSGGDDAAPDTTDAAQTAAGQTPTDDGATGDGDVTDALEAGAPEETVEVPPADGATTIAEYAAGGSGYEPADEQELAQILALVGTDADGYLTEDAVVVRSTKADATLICGSVGGFSIEAYTVIPVLPDGTGLDCG